MENATFSDYIWHKILENIMIDDTIVRAHACAAGAPQKRLSDPPDQAL